MFLLGPYVRNVFQKKFVVGAWKRKHWLVPRAYIGSTSTPETNAKIIFSQEIDVKSFNKLTVRSHQCSVQLSPVTTFADKTINLSVLSEKRHQIHNFIKITEENDSLNIEAKRPNDSCSDVFEATIKLLIPLDISDFDVFLSGGGSGHVSQLEARAVNVEIENGGHFNVKNMKCAKLSVRCDNGDVTCDGHVTGDIYLQTAGDGQITVQKLQGNNVDLRAENGDIKAEAIYCGSCLVSGGDRSNVTLANVHGSCQIHVNNGRLQIAGIDGDLKAYVKFGDAQVHIARLQHPDQSLVMVSEGDLKLTLDPQLTALVRLEGKDVVMDENANCEGQMMDGDNRHVVYQGQMNGAVLPRDPLIVGIAHGGKVHLGSKSWFSSLKFT